MRVSLDWLKDMVAVKGSAEKIAHDLTMAGLEVKKVFSLDRDAVLETEVTTNRPDWLSHIGVARELHAISGARFSLPPHENKIVRKSERSVTISIQDRELCTYYSACILEGIEPVDTPREIKERLENCGIRPVHFLVDVTNYVLLEWGQPLHAFDLDQLHGSHIAARRAHTGEHITSINGKVYELTEDDLVIADEKGPVAIAGVMGGKESEVGRHTKNILLESAFFAPFTVRKTSRHFALASESSYRFERRVDPAGVDEARERAIYLIRKYANPKRVSRVFCAGRPPISKINITLPLREIKKVLGVGIPPAQAKTYLTRLGLRVSGGKSSIGVSVPSFRSDLTRPVDLIEELARLYGYGRIPETLPLVAPLEPRVDPLLALEEKTRGLCTGLGLDEVITYSFVESRPYEMAGYPKDRWVKLINPQNKELNLMRPSLLTGLAAVTQKNMYVGRDRVWIFEIGNRYLSARTRELPVEERTLALAISGSARDNWLEKPRQVNFYDLKGVVDTFLSRAGIREFRTEEASDSVFRAGKGIAVLADGAKLGVYGELSDQMKRFFDIEKPVFAAEFNLQELLRLCQGSTAVADLPRFPPSPRDLTLILPERARSETVMDRIEQLGRGLIQDIKPFACFHGEKLPKGKKSLSYRILYQSLERTLQNDEVNTLHFDIIRTLETEFGASLPSAATVPPVGQSSATTAPPPSAAP